MPTDEKTLKKFQKMMAVFDDDTMTRTEFLKNFENVVNLVMKVEKRNADFLDEAKVMIENIKTHVRGASESDFLKLKSQVFSEIGMLSSKLESKSKQIDDKMAQLRDGLDGKDADEESVIMQVLARIKLPEYRAPMMDGPDEIRNKLEVLQGLDRLDKSAIKGIEQIEEKVQEISLRPTGRLGGAKGIGLYIGGAKKLLTAQQINLIAGSGIALTYAHANGRNDITISATGSVALTPIAMTGDIDDSNVSFTAASEPSIVIVNGASYRHGAGVTISGTSVTLDNPVGTGGDLYGL